MVTLQEAGKLGPFAPPQIVEFANRTTLRKPDLDVLRPELMDQYAPLAHLLQNAFKSCEERKELLLPNLKDFTNCVAVFSDYGGDHGRYLSYSFLVTDWHVIVGPFAEQLRRLRARHGLGLKEIAYKDLAYGPMRRALRDFLLEVDYLPGFLCTILVQKNITTLFGADNEENKLILRQALEQFELSDIKPKIAQRLLTITHCSAFLVSMLSRKGQRVFWMTDHDAISPSPLGLQKLLNVFASVLGLYSNERKFELIGGAVPFAQKSVETLDGLSVADLAAGASSNLLTQIDLVGLPNTRVKDGVEAILLWLARQSVGLKKSTIVIRETNGALSSGVVKITPKSLPDGAMILPFFVP